MKTSWKKTKRWDEYLHRRARPEEALLTEAELIVDSDLRETLRWQQRTYALVQQYGRQQLRREIQAAQDQLFSRPEHRSFREMILRLFS